MIKMFATDIDHTLYNSEANVICEKNVKAIERLIENGIAVCFASSRNYDGTLLVAKDFKLDQYDKGYLVSLNGSKSEHLKDHRLLTNETFTVEQISFLKDLANKLGTNFAFIKGNYSVTPLFSKIMEYNYEHVGNDIILTKDVMKYAENGQISQCMLFDDNLNMYKLFESLDDEIKSLFNYNVPQPPVLDVSLKYVNKKFGVDAVVRDLGIDWSEVAASGDNDNDIPMLKAAGISACVSNGSENAKKAATYVVGSDIDGGVADFINKYIFGDK